MRHIFSSRNRARQMRVSAFTLNRVSLICCGCRCTNSKQGREDKPTIALNEFCLIFHFFSRRDFGTLYAYAMHSEKPTTDAQSFIWFMLPMSAVAVVVTIMSLFSWTVVVSIIQTVILWLAAARWITDNVQNMTWYNMKTYIVYHKLHVFGVYYYYLFRVIHPFRHIVTAKFVHDNVKCLGSNVFH